MIFSGAGPAGRSPARRRRATGPAAAAACAAQSGRSSSARTSASPVSTAWVPSIRTARVPVAVRIVASLTGHHPARMDAQTVGGGGTVTPRSLPPSGRVCVHRAPLAGRIRCREAGGHGHSVTPVITALTSGSVSSCRCPSHHTDVLPLGDDTPPNTAGSTSGRRPRRRPRARPRLPAGPAGDADRARAHRRRTTSPTCCGRRTSRSCARSSTTPRRRPTTASSPRTCCATPASPPAACCRCARTPARRSSSASAPRPC